MRTTKKVWAVILISTVMALAVSPVGQAAAPKVSTDETMYVNLDYYGKIDKINIVKGCSLNGNKKFTDYGAYSKVTNMSNSVVPVITEDSVTWKLPEDTQRFYYECTPQDKTVALPWNFDVSYKLNGMPADAQKLAGASGLVEINIKVMPNQNVADYLKNNMLLMAGTQVNMSDHLSFEAPGAQLQSIGEAKVALFAAIPGEETTFTMRIGTQRFETSGIVMMIVPGTLEQMKNIKAIKEAKDTVDDSLNAIHDSTNEILEVIENMSGGLKQVQSGLHATDKARDTISTSKDGLFDEADRSIADINTVAEQMQLLAPHLKNAQTMVNDVNAALNALIKDISATKPYLNNLTHSIKDIQDDVKDLRNDIDELQVLERDRENILNQLDNEIAGVRTSMTGLQTILDSMNTNLTKLTTDFTSLQGMMAALPLSDTDHLLFAQVISGMVSSLQPVIDSTNQLTYAINMLCGQSGDYLDTAEETFALVESYFDKIEKSLDDVDQLLKHSNKLGDTLIDLSKTGTKIIDDTTALNNTLNKYIDETVITLKETEELTVRITNTLSSSAQFLSSFNTLMQNSSGDLDEGARQSLNGLIDVLEQSLDGIKKTTIIRNASDTIKKALDEQMNKYEEDSNLLKLDAEAKPVSFTSSQNPSPQSIQVILRTEEISLDDNDNEADLEKEKENIGIWGRIYNLFLKIWQSLVSLFS